MQLTYDRESNVAYLRLKPRTGADLETVAVSDHLNVDLAADGTVYGIEFLNANEQLRGSDGGRIVFVDPMTGEERVLEVA